MDDEDQYFEKNTIFMSNFFHNAMCQILMDEWQLMELHNSWMSCFDKIAIELQWVAPYIQWTCSLTFMAYKYSELQMSNTIQKLSYKASYK
jgi:hypothetical protein